MELDLIIGALQTFTVLFLVFGVYLATHKTGGSQISAEPAFPAPTRDFTLLRLLERKPRPSGR